MLRLQMVDLLQLLLDSSEGVGGSDIDALNEPVGCLHLDILMMGDHPVVDDDVLILLGDHIVERLGRDEFSLDGADLNQFAIVKLKILTLCEADFLGVLGLDQSEGFVLSPEQVVWGCLYFDSVIELDDDRLGDDGLVS